MKLFPARPGATGRIVGVAAKNLQLQPLAHLCILGTNWRSWMAGNELMHRRSMRMKRMESTLGNRVKPGQCLKRSNLTKAMRALWRQARDIAAARFLCAGTVMILMVCGAWISLFAVPAAAMQAAIIWGRVVDQATGEPLGKVRVVLRPSDLQTVSDGQGAYRLDGVPPGKYEVQVSTIGYRLLKREIRLEEGQSQEIEFYLGQEASTIHETVRVTAPVYEEVEKAAASQITLNSTEIKNLAGVLIDDPLRSVQTLPGVAAGDDFNAYYSVRAGGFENNGILVDGVLTHNLAHTLQGTQDPAGSVTILNGDLVDSMALYTMAFSAKYGDRTASFLDVTTREGSRDRFRTRIAVSGTNAAIVAEGPLDPGKKGAWIASARKSYAGYLIRRLGTESDLDLGFTDAQGKVVYELTGRQKLGGSFVWGRSVLSRDPADRGITSIIDGINNVGVANMSWVWTPGPRLYLESRLCLIRETFENRNKNDAVLDEGHHSEVTVRSDLSFLAGRGHRLELGFLSRDITADVLDRRYNYGLQQFVDFNHASGSYWQHAAYLQDRWAIRGDRLTAIFGGRVDTTGLTGETLVHPRVSIEWRWGAGNKLDAGWGVFSQFPEVLPVLGRNGNRDLPGEIARHYVLGYERLLGSNSRARIEVFAKQESNLQRSRNSLYRLMNGKVTPPDMNFRYDSALRGETRGFEVFLQRRSANRLSGWISYTYARSRRHDLVTGEWYNSDYDQRHTVNAYGGYRVTESWSLSIKARFGSGFPYPGYFEQRGSDFYLTTIRNRERLPLYSRVDVRVNKAFYFKRSKLSLYLEVLNVFNHENLRYDQTFSVNSSTRKVSLGRDSLFPILPTAGFVLEF